MSFIRNSIRRQLHVMKFYIPLPQPALGVPRVGLDKPLRTSLVENESLFPFQVPWNQSTVGQSCMQFCLIAKNFEAGILKNQGLSLRYKKVCHKWK